MVVADVLEPTPRPDEVLIEVSAVGICGTDVHILQDVYRHADPLIPGHELVGNIVALGDEVEEWRAGERVVSELHTGADRTCPLCLRGDPQICPAKRALGTWTDGAFAEKVALPAWLLHRVPDSVSDPVATLIEPAACSLHGMLERSAVGPDDAVLVVGHGPIGLLGAQVALAAGADPVIVCGRSRHGTSRLDAARALGVHVLDSDHDNVVARVLALTGGLGVDVAVEAAGTQDTLSTCLDACRPGGRVVVLGLSGRESVAFPWDHALLRDLDVTFSFSSKSSSWERVIELTADGRLGGELLVTHRFALEEWRDAFAAVSSGDAVKVLFEP